MKSKISEIHFRITYIFSGYVWELGSTWVDGNVLTLKSYIGCYYNPKTNQTRRSIYNYMF